MSGKDSRLEIPIGLSSFSSDLVQKAIEIDVNMIQQRIDDELQIAEKEENQNQ